TVGVASSHRRSSRTAPFEIRRYVGIETREGAAMVTVGVLARLEAKPGKEEEVATFLAGALPLAEQERATTAWFAIRIGPSTFGIFDVFPDDTGRDAHLS